MNEHPGCGCPFCGGSDEPKLPHPPPLPPMSYELVEPGKVEALRKEIGQYKIECEHLHGEVNNLTSLLERNEGRIKQIVDEKLLRERNEYRLLARELAAELRRWFEFRPFAWRFDPSAWVGPSAIEREGFLALHSSATELLSRPEIKALQEEELKT